MADGSGNTFAAGLNGSGLSNAMTSKADVSAGFWTSPYKPSFETAASDVFSNESATDIVIGAATVSCMISFRMNLAATASTLAAIWGKEHNGATEGMSLVIVENGGATRLRAEYQVSGESAKNIVASTGGIDDGNDHHVVYFHDRGGNRGIYIDNVSDVVSGTVDMSDSILSQGADAATFPFLIGARGSLTSTAAPLALVNATQKAKIWDFSVYTVTGNLPSGYTALIEWLYRNPYGIISTDMW